jgi:hypothetical protein
MTASNFGATPAGGVYEGKPNPRLPNDPDANRQFLIDLDNQLSRLTRNIRSIREAVQKELGWSDDGE